MVIVTAGTSDLPVAEEARETALWTGAAVEMVQDVGVAGPHRLAAKLPLLEAADAIVVVAGMEGALPSVVGGYVVLSGHRRADQRRLRRQFRRRGGLVGNAQQLRGERLRGQHRRRFQRRLRRRTDCQNAARGRKAAEARQGADRGLSNFRSTKIGLSPGIAMTASHEEPLPRLPPRPADAHKGDFGTALSWAARGE